MGLVESEDGEGCESYLGEEVFLGGVGLVEQEAQVEAVDVYHYGLDLSQVAVVGAVELEIAVLVEALFLLRHGHIVEYVYLR